MEPAEDQRAERSCVSCQRLKRRCSKDLPTCQLCARVGRRCDYPTIPLTPTRSDPDSSTARNQTSTRTTPGAYLFRSDDVSSSPIFPSRKEATNLATCFLDSVATRGADGVVPRIISWQEICPGLDEISASEASSILEKYFSTTHSWFPIISKSRIYRSLQSADVLANANTQILLHVMQLDHGALEVGHAADENFAQYKKTKMALFALEQSAMFSTNFLAAQALMALHEIGHGTFPAAYLTVSNLARLFIALGLHDRKKATQILPRPNTWLETEERRRLWWAVLILDRYVHVGIRFRPLCTPKIPPDELLPARDASWDAGELTVNPLLVMSIEASTSVDPFARTCQAAHLLGWVCEHVNQHATSQDADMHFQEAFAIAGALRALLAMLHSESSHASPEERQKLFAARGLAYAALNTLYDVHACVEPDNVESVGGNRGLRLDLQQHALDGYKEVIVDVSAFAVEIERYYESRGLDDAPVLVLFSLYTVAGTYAWYVRESGAARYLDALANLRRVLGTLAGKWRVASLYLEMLEAQEHSHQGGQYQ